MRVSLWRGSEGRCWIIEQQCQQDLGLQLINLCHARVAFGEGTAVQYGTHRAMQYSMREHRQGRAFGTWRCSTFCSGRLRLWSDVRREEHAECGKGLFGCVMGGVMES